MRIGASSSDGIVVNCHFGRSKVFYIYEVSDDGGISLSERRELPPVCDGGEHDDHMLAQVADRLRDLDVLIASRVGQGARNVLEEKGIEVYELPMPIEDAIQKVLAYQKVKAMVEGAFAS